MLDYYDICVICPRNCGINRNVGETGYCGETAVLRVGNAGVHRGEEPLITGTGGSGTIFISGCNLGCVFCQCYQVSQGERGLQSFGKPVSIEEFAKICVDLCNKGVENINIVTGSHVVPVIVEGIIAAKKLGVKIPFLWNSSGYESREALELLYEHIDIFMPDLKTLDTEISKKFFNAPDYPSVAKAAILKMIEIIQKKSTEKTCEKVIIRHLILPGYLDSTRSVLKWFAENVKGHALLSLMTQYTPLPNRDVPLPDRDVPLPDRDVPLPNRYVNKDEYKIVMGYLDEFKIEDGFYQEVITGDGWLPDFRRINPFPPDISVPVWSVAAT